MTTEPSPADKGVARIEIDDPMFCIRLDDAAGIVRVSRLALQQPSDVDRYADVLSSVLRTARQRFGKARVLADLRQSPVRTQTTAERLRQCNESLYRPGERVALLVETSLLKMQLRRNLIPEYQNIFMSENAAVTWLLAGG